MISELKHTMKTGSLVRLASNLQFHSFNVEDGGDYTTMDPVLVKPLDIGMVVDDLIEEEEPFHMLVLFCEKIVRADCRVLRRVK